MSVNLTQQGIFNASGDVNANLLKTVPKSANTTTYNAYQISMIENLVAGQTYTIQLYDVNISHSAKTEAQLNVYVYWGGGSVSLVGWQGTTYFTNGHADLLYKTFTVTSSQAGGNGAANLWLNIYNSVGYVAGTMSLTIGKWKLEKGNVPTPWVPSTADDIYVGSTHGFNEQQSLPNAKLYENNILATNFIEW